MNTYVQDSTIPVYIVLNYHKFYTLKFPINPESLERSIPSASEKVNIEGLGEVSIPKTPSLSKITIKSFFWKEQQTLSSPLYIDWLLKWQKSKEPANLIVTRFNYSMKVTCESFRFWRNAGEEDDIYFELVLQEFRTYGAKRLSEVKNDKLKELLKTLNSLPVSPILTEIPKGNRDNIGKATIYNPYVTTKNETICSITRKVTGSSTKWKELYDNNKSKFGDMYMNNEKLKSGTKLILPDSWVNDKSYGIQSLKGGE